VQLCAQALCLEEMLGITVAEGALFYGQRKRRTAVAIDDHLRDVTTSAIERLRQLIEGSETPPAVRDARCDNCSLIELCLPDATSGHRSASAFTDRSFAGHLETRPQSADAS